MSKDLAYLKDWTHFILDSNPLQSNPDFPDARITKAINAAYEEEVNRAKTETSILFFHLTNTFTWPADTQTIDITASPNSWLQYADTFLFQDITEDANRPRDFTPLWRDRTTLLWYHPDGPQSARTVRVTYLAVAEELSDDADVPLLIAPSHANLLAWSAAILLSEIADNQAPPNWYRRRDEIRFSWWKTLESRPRENQSRITPLGETVGLYRSGELSPWDEY